jgi:hypothetical protein
MEDVAKHYTMYIHLNSNVSAKCDRKDTEPRFSGTFKRFGIVKAFTDRLCGVVVTVSCYRSRGPGSIPGYRFRGPGSIPGATRFSEK